MRLTDAVVEELTRNAAAATPTPIAITEAMFNILDSGKYFKLYL